MLLALACGPWSELGALPKSGHVQVEGLLITWTTGDSQVPAGVGMADL